MRCVTQGDPPLIAHRGQLHHEVFGLNEFHRDDRIDAFFPQASTQIDSLRHFAHPDHGFYNGTPSEQITAGTEDLGIQHVAEAGIAGWGVLLDADRYRASAAGPSTMTTTSRSRRRTGGDRREPGYRFSAGDILLIRFGWVTHVVRSGAGYHGRSCGLEQSEATAAWLWDHQFSLVAADNIALEAWPSDRWSSPLSSPKPTAGCRFLPYRDAAPHPDSVAGPVHRRIVGPRRPSASLCQIAAVRARMRCSTRDVTPGQIRNKPRR